MPQITVGEETFQRLREKARGEGFADLPDYLENLASEADEFEMTPDIDADLEKGLEDIRAGRVLDESVMPEDIQRMRREWHEKRR